MRPRLNNRLQLHEPARRLAPRPEPFSTRARYLTHNKTRSR
jgi:hypothetical protein